MRTNGSGFGTDVEPDVVLVKEKLKSLKLNGPLYKSSKLTRVVPGSQSAWTRAWVRESGFREPGPV